MNLRERLMRRPNGFGLVEVLVALVIGSILTLGIGQVFIASSQSYRMGDALARIQENGRFVVSRMQREFRMAGSQAQIPDDPGGLTIHLPAGIDELDEIRRSAIYGSDGIDADDGTLHGNTPTTSSGLSLAAFPASRDANADAVTFIGLGEIAGGTNTDCLIEESTQTSGTTVKLTEPTGGSCPDIPAGQMLMLTDQENGDLFQRNNNVSATENVNIQTGGWSNAEKIDYSRYFQSGAANPALLGLQQTQYYIADDTACTGKTLLKRVVPITYNDTTNTFEADTSQASTPDALVCDVGTLQIAYAVSDEIGEPVSEYSDARAVDFDNDAVTGLGMTFLLRGNQNVSGIDARSTVSFVDGIDASGSTASSSWPASSGQPAVPANRMSKVFSVIIGLRNRQNVI